MRILITGAGGMLGTAVTTSPHWPHQLAPLTHAELDITDPTAVRRAIDAIRPAAVLHLAAWTDVDGCERDPDRAYAVNTKATAHIANLCRERDILLMFTSSIAVFDGRQPHPYSEIDRPNPANVHGATKLAAEQAVATVPRHYIVRCGWLFGGGERDKKFVQLIIRLAAQQDVIPVVDDCVGSPTYVADLAEGLARLLASGQPYGVYHMVNAGPQVSRYELAREIVSLLGLNVTIKPVGSDYFPHLAPRPAMEAACSRYLDGWLRSWPSALRAYLVGP